jgi:fumarate reductase flavoprotein subunit
VAVMYPWMRWLGEHVREQKGTILAETAAKALVRDSGRIVGVKAEHGGGETYVRALRGVILAGSSFTNNRVKIKKYCPWVYERAVGTFLPPIDTGEVVRMGLGAGADLAGQDSWTLLRRRHPFLRHRLHRGSGSLMPWFQYLRQGYLQVVRNAGWLEMNANCEEFLPEGAKLDYEQHPKTITGQPGHRAYVVFDSNYQTTLWQTLPPPMLDDRPMTLKDPEYPWFDKFAKYVPKDYRESVRQAIDRGGIKVADSLPELGKRWGWTRSG